MFPHLPGFIRLVATLLAISIPLGVWKLVEIIIWLFNNVTVNVGG